MKRLLLLLPFGFSIVFFDTNVQTTAQAFDEERATQAQQAAAQAVQMAQAARERTEIYEFLTAIQNGKNNKVRLMIENKKDLVNARDSRDHSHPTALMVAAEWGQTAIAQLLLENGADINAVDNSGRTALDIAISNNQQAVKHLLTQRGAKRGERKR